MSLFSRIYGNSEISSYMIMGKCEPYWTSRYMFGPLRDLSVNSHVSFPMEICEEVKMSCWQKKGTTINVNWLNSWREPMKYFSMQHSTHSLFQYLCVCLLWAQYSVRNFERLKKGGRNCNFCFWWHSPYISKWKIYHSVWKTSNYISIRWNTSYDSRRLRGWGM